MARNATYHNIRSNGPVINLSMVHLTVMEHPGDPVKTNR